MPSPRMAERLGIVYTPVEVVDFIIQSSNVALQKHFGSSLNDRDVQILDPFTGTGTFLVRLLQSGLIRPEDLKHKYVNELHANEIVLLAYYIAAINIESSYHAVTGEYHPFDGIVLTDTFQMNETRDLVDNNLVICATGRGANKPFCTLLSSTIPDYELVSKGQCFPLYWYEQADTSTPAEPTLALDGPAETPDEHGYIRREAITDWALSKFRTHYSDQGIMKEDLFWYVYGILHSLEYRDRFADNLKRMLPRIPLAKDFWAFSKAGRQLGEWHLNYETVEPYPLEEDTKRLVMEPEDYRVHKMVFGKSVKEKDKSVIIYNPHLTLRGIPLEAYDYIVNGKSAIEWLMERYAVTKHKQSGIPNDANDWSDDPRYIVDLLKRIVRVSLETVVIVNALPPLEEES